MTMASRSGLGLIALLVVTVAGGFFAVRLLRNDAARREPPTTAAVAPHRTRRAEDRLFAADPGRRGRGADVRPRVHSQSLRRRARRPRHPPSRTFTRRSPCTRRGDYVRAAVEDAKKRGDSADVEFTPIFKELLACSDAYTAKVLTPAFIETGAVARPPCRRLEVEPDDEHSRFSFNLAAARSRAARPPGSNRKE